MYSKRLSELGISSKYGCHSEQEIQELEVEMGVTLPSEYKNFLQRFGTLDFDDQEIIFYPAKHLVTHVDIEARTFVNFYGLENDDYDVRVLKARYEGRLPDEVIPIAECPGGDQLCIGVKKETIGKIYHWDHHQETMHASSEKELWQALVLLHNNFKDFIMSFEKQEGVDPLEDSMIEEIKVSDKFLSRLNSSSANTLLSKSKKFR
ncbi:SMI1/KNR4 family protein [Sporosarcina sp. ACRSM]|uniref:SMI1/KNR4 family protein n=1 Tax=Sporosarcina sp. ACRSM TaxID=2918216 RepID=UPI001EF3FB0A|nr:SMI1/KNR4 family protein [Sporosarcina sp. ACRSM]MCG7336901.1 SMI1/KNR4 family protein [Sporosarcina sp. ACRSM]